MDEKDVDMMDENELIMAIPAMLVAEIIREDALRSFPGEMIEDGPMAGVSLYWANLYAEDLVRKAARSAVARIMDARLAGKVGE